MSETKPSMDLRPPPGRLHSCPSAGADPRCRSRSGVGTASRTGRTLRPGALFAGGDRASCHPFAKPRSDQSRPRAAACDNRPRPLLGNRSSRLRPARAAARHQPDSADGRPICAARGVSADHRRTPGKHPSERPQAAAGGADPAGVPRCPWQHHPGWFGRGGAGNHPRHRRRSGRLTAWPPPRQATAASAAPP